VAPDTACVKRYLWADLVRTTSFRLALLYALLFGGSAVVVFAVIYWAATSAMSDQLDAELNAERAALEASYGAGGIDALSSAIAERLTQPVHPLRYLLEDASGRVLVGDLPNRPSLPVGRSEIEIPVVRLSGDANQKRGLFRILRMALKNDGFLLLGDDAHPLEELREFLIGAFGWGAGATLVLAVLGSMAMSTSVLRRVEAINRASERIMAGELDRRLPTTTGDWSGSGDEFDRLTANLNIMLDRIEVLVQGLRQVSTDIAHDLRTPLGRLRRTLELARDSEPANARSAALAVIDQAIEEVDALLATFGALLRIGQIEAGASRRGFGPVDLSAVLEAVIEVYTPAAEEKNHTLTRRICTGIIVSGDRALLTQMLANLVENAIRHSPPGACIDVALFAPDGIEGPQVTISDDGPGIPEAERDKVFRRFYRLDASRSTPGNGLGLALVAAVSDLHGAKIQLYDNPPRGLRVVLSFDETIAPPVTAQQFHGGAYCSGIGGSYSSR
jgi:signal transduction histidine kinase